MATMTALARRRFAPQPEEVRRARRFARETVLSWGLDPADAVLVVGELSTNAVVHGRTPFTVGLASSGQGHIRIDVEDANPRMPAMVTVPRSANSGRGLALVDRLARSWGVDSHHGAGKVVWAELGSRSGDPPG